MMLEIADDTIGSAVPRLPGLRAAAGSNVAILGAAGTGKTQFCLALAGLEDSGAYNNYIMLDARRMSDISMRDRAISIGLVPSDAALAFSGIKPDVRGELELAWRLLGHQPSDREVGEFAARFGLERLLDHDPYTLSGGECARLALAISTVKKPKLLIIDQVADHLDDETAEFVRTGLAAVLPVESVVVETRSRRNGPTIMYDANSAR